MYIYSNREPRITALLAVALIHAGLIYLFALHTNNTPFNSSVSVQLLNVGWLEAAANSRSEITEQNSGRTQTNAKKLNPQKTTQIARVPSQTLTKRVVTDNEQNSTVVDSSSAYNAVAKLQTTSSSINTGAENDEHGAEAPGFDAAYLQNPSPPYPSLSRELGEQGRVLLRVLVTADGSVQRIELYQSSGFERLDRAASKTVSSWHFIPGKKDGQPISTWIIVPIMFSLRG